MITGMSCSMTRRLAWSSSRIRSISGPNASRLALGDARGRLIEAQHARTGRHEARELDHPAGTGRQLVDESVDEGTEPEERDDFVRFAPCDALPGPDTGHRESDRLAHGQVLEQLRALERPTEAESRAPRGREAMHVVTEDLDRTPAADESADRVHQRRLAGAVRADEPDDLTRRNVEVDVIDHEPRAERNAELPDPDHRVERRPGSRAATR